MTTPLNNFLGVMLDLRMIVASHVAPMPAYIQTSLTVQVQTARCPSKVKINNPKTGHYQSPPIKIPRRWTTPPDLRRAEEARALRAVLEGHPSQA